jgi:hypothetical protein
MLKIKDIQLSNTKKKNLNGLSQWVSIKVEECCKSKHK